MPSSAGTMEVLFASKYTLTPSDFSGPPSYNIWTVMLYAMPAGMVSASVKNTMPFGANGNVCAHAEQENPAMTSKPINDKKITLFNDRDVIPHTSSIITSQVKDIKLFS